jgi:hypothetical protein
MSKQILRIDEIPELIRVETHSLDEVSREVERRYRSTIPHDDVYGSFVTLNRHLDVPLDYVFEYLANVENVQEFTLSLRNFRRCEGRDRLWVGEDHFGTNTKIYMRCEANRETYCIDQPCAWNNSEDLWMYYAFRLYDGARVMDRPGTVIQWTNFKHTNYLDGGPFIELIEAFPRFFEIHGIELDNLCKILRSRFKHEYGYLLSDVLPGAPRGYRG